MTAYLFVMTLLLPGMSAQVDTREPMESLESCMSRVHEATEAIKEHEGQEYQLLIGCELIGKKADPA